MVQSRREKTVQPQAKPHAHACYAAHSASLGVNCSVAFSVGFHHAPLLCELGCVVRACESGCAVRALQCVTPRRTAQSAMRLATRSLARLSALLTSYTHTCPTFV